jgi:cytochrome b subunit of formate dehydrogenase
MTALDRYLNPKEKEIANEISDWIETKQNLDFQYASQRLLKLWLFVHIPATYALILLALVHAYVATIYAGRL